MRRRAAVLGALVLLAAAGARADDTDIYMNGILPTNSVPLVMLTLDTGTDAAAVYAGCAQVGSGLSMCAPAKYFADHCPNCTLPAANQPLTYFHVMKYAIRMIVEGMSGFKVGLMLNHNHENNCAGPRSLLPDAKQRCSNGGYIARGFKILDRVTIAGNPLLGIPDTTVVGPNTQEFLTILESIPLPSSGTAHPYQGKELFFELFRYLTGQGVYNGHNGYTDYGTDNSQNLDADRPAVDWDSSIEAGGRYLSPLTADLACTKVFTVNFMLRSSRQDDDSDDAIDSDLPGGMIGLSLKPPNNRFEHVIGYLHDVDLGRATLPFGTVPALSGRQNVTSYFFTLPTPLDSDPATFDRTMTDYAQHGGTIRPQALASDPATLVEGVRATMNQILSVSTTFVSASVPVNVFSRTQLLNDVYVALFQPDSAARPFWVGNVKKLKSQVYEVPCGADAPPGCVPTRQVRLVDAMGTDAIEDDGRIRNNALTFWTDGSRIAANSMRGVTAGRDGRFVDLGGAGQKIPGYLTAAPGYTNADLGARQLYLYPGVGTALVPLSADVSAALTYASPLGAANSVEALRILKHIRGYDEYDQDGDLNTTEVRPWLMADPLHSRPLAINYGALPGYSTDNPAVFIAVGTNDGLMHFIRNTASGGAESGAEAWAVLPFDLMGIQKALALNAALPKRLYGVDGAPTALVKDVDRDGTIEAADGDRVYLYFGMRRGGRAYYALDVTDPATPRFLWRITPTSRAWGASADGTGGSVATLDFAELGLTFSQPKTARVKVGVDASGNAIVKDAIVFAGGYDATANDYTADTKTLYGSGLASPGSINTDDTMGNAIYVVDAATGELIWKAVGPVAGVLPPAAPGVFRHAGLKDSIPSTVTVVDANGDGYTDRIVVGDTGGNLWRADLGDDADGTPLPVAQADIVDDWELNLLARLGRHAASGKLDDRRFFHEPDYVLSRDELGPFDAIVIGSGDREDPLDYGRVRTLLPTTETLAQNAFYMIKDRRIGTYSRDDSDPATILTPSSLADATDNCVQDLSIARTDCQLDFSNGWFIRLQEGRGEKLLAGALTAANRVYFSTYLPPASNEATTCGPSEGTGLFYAVGLQQATAVFNYNTADCPAGGCGSEGPNTARDRFELLTSAGIPAEVVYLSLPDAAGNEVRCALTSDLNCRSLPGATRFRTFWYKQE
jgi:type IV pilus assembly protein PilY1